METQMNTSVKVPSVVLLICKKIIDLLKEKKTTKTMLMVTNIFTIDVFWSFGFFVKN
jgi:hypothetical protein